MNNTRQRSTALALAASQLLAASGADVTAPVAILPLAKVMQEQTGCHITTAKSHIARAIRKARHEMAVDQFVDAELSRIWGGTRPGAGRPKTT